MMQSININAPRDFYRQSSMQLSESTRFFSSNLSQSQFQGADASLGVSVIQEKEEGAEPDYMMDNLKMSFRRNGKDESEVAYNYDENNKFAEFDLTDVNTLEFKFLNYQESTVSDVVIKFEYSFT